MNNENYDLIRRSFDVDNASESNHLISGNLLFVSLSAKATAPEGYIAQQPRETANLYRTIFSRNNQQLHVYFHPDLLNYPKHKFALCLDSYLQWGWKQTGITVVIGGIESEFDDFHVDILVFSSGRLIEVYDRELPGTGNRRFASDAQSVVAEVIQKHPSASVYVAAPLSKWDVEETQFLTKSEFAKLRFKTLSVKENTVADFIIPILISTLSVAAFVSVIGMDWMKYKESKEQFQKAAADPVIVKQGGVDTYYINVMSQRRMFMDSPRQQVLLSSNARTIINAVSSVPNVRIIELKLPAPLDSGAITTDRPKDVWISLSVPKSTGSGLSQLEELSTSLTSFNGIDIGSTHQKWQEDQQNRIYSLEGYIHGK